MDWPVIDRPFGKLIIGIRPPTIIARLWCGYLPLDGEREQLAALKEFLDAHPDAPAEAIEKTIYDLGRAHYDKPGKIFPLMYRAILGQERGPRLGAFIRLATLQRISQLIDESLRSAAATNSG